MTVGRVEFFVEEPSVREALQVLVPRIRPDLAQVFDVHAFDGKADLLQKLPVRLRGYRGWLPDDWRIVVLLDEDREDCLDLKQRVEAMARSAGLAPKPRRGTGRFQVLTRIVVEELESWFFGDVSALATTYKGVPPTLHHKRQYRDPDAIAGGTWEALERVLQNAGHFGGGLPKIQVARQVAANMDPDRNTSRSFQAFRAGLRNL